MAIFDRRRDQKFAGADFMETETEAGRPKEDMLTRLFGNKKVSRDQDARGIRVRGKNQVGVMEGPGKENRGELLFRKLEGETAVQDPRVGEDLEVTVGYIRDSGAAVFAEDGTRRWLYIGEITNGYVDRIDDYLQVGDRIKARVIPSQVPDRWRVSAKALGGLEPRYRNRVEGLTGAVEATEGGEGDADDTAGGDKAQAEPHGVGMAALLYAEALSRPASSTAECRPDGSDRVGNLRCPPLAQTYVSPASTGNEGPVSRKVPRTVGATRVEEMGMLTRFLRGKLGEISPEAEAKFNEIMGREGTVKVALLIPTLLEEWDPWFSFLDLLEGKLGDRKAVGEDWRGG